MNMLGDDPDHLARIRNVTRWFKEQGWSWRNCLDIQVALLAGLVQGKPDQWRIVVDRVREFADDMEDMFDERAKIIGFVRPEDIRPTDRVYTDADFVRAIRAKIEEAARQNSHWALGGHDVYAADYMPSAERTILIRRWL